MRSGVDRWATTESLATHGLSVCRQPAAEVPLAGLGLSLFRPAVMPPAAFPTRGLFAVFHHPLASANSRGTNPLARFLLLAVVAGLPLLARQATGAVLAATAAAGVAVP